MGPWKIQLQNEINFQSFNYGGSKWKWPAIGEKGVKTDGGIKERILRNELQLNADCGDERRERKIY